MYFLCIFSLMCVFVYNNDVCIFLAYNVCIFVHYNDVCIFTDPQAFNTNSPVLVSLIFNNGVLTKQKERIFFTNTQLIFHSLISRNVFFQFWNNCFINTYNKYYYIIFLDAFPSLNQNAQLPKNQSIITFSVKKVFFVLKHFSCKQFTWLLDKLYTDI